MVRALAVVLLAGTACSSPPRVVEAGYQGRYTVSDPDVLDRAGSSRAYVVGSVVAREGRSAISGALVRTADGGHRTRADSLGRFRLALPPGAYVVEASYVGFVELATAPVEVEPRTVRQVRFELGSYAL